MLPPVLPTLPTYFWQHCDLHQKWLLHDSAWTPSQHLIGVNDLCNWALHSCIRGFERRLEKKVAFHVNSTNASSQARVSACSFRDPGTLAWAEQFLILVLLMINELSLFGYSYFAPNRMKEATWSAGSLPAFPCDSKNVGQLSNLVNIHTLLSVECAGKH